MSDDTLRRFCCQDGLNSRTNLATVPLNPMGGGTEGFHTGTVCTDCEREIVEDMKAVNAYRGNL